jgi:hypothetical protein
MKICLDITYKEPPGKVDEFLDEEMPPFQYCLEELLGRFIKGKVIFEFSGEKKIVLDLFYDFSVCFEEIVDSVIQAKSGDTIENMSIWFCEQGSDFYMGYAIRGGSIFIAFKKGERAGLPNREMDDFFVEVNRGEYVKEWQYVFKRITDLFMEKLNKKIDSPI